MGDIPTPTEVILRKMSQERPKKSSTVGTWARRVLALAILASGTGVAVTAGPGILKAIQNPENSAATSIDARITSVDAQGLTEFDLSKDYKGKVPLKATATIEIDGQQKTVTGLLEPDYSLDGTEIHGAGPRIVDGSIETNDQGVITETGSGLTVDQITFVSSSAPTSSTSSQ
jgi:hypothetical protein